MARDGCLWCCDTQTIARNNESFKAAVLAILCDIAEASGALDDTDTFEYLNLGNTGQVASAAPSSIEGYYIWNANLTTPMYVKIYDKLAAPTAADTPKLRLMIPPGGGANLSDMEIPFLLGIGVRATTEPTDAGTTSPGANEVGVNIFYRVS